MAMNARANSAESSADMVMVGCKSPMGVVLNMDKYVKANDTYVNRVEGQETVTLLGWSVPWGAPDPTTAGYRMTPVPRDFWNEWRKQHPNFSMLKDRTIIGPEADTAGQTDTAGKAREHAKIDRMFRQARIGDAPKLADGTKLEMAPESARPQEVAA